MMYFLILTHLDTLLLQLLKERRVLHLLLRLTSHIVDVGLVTDQNIRKVCKMPWEQVRESLRYLGNVEFGLNSSEPSVQVHSLL